MTTDSTTLKPAAVTLPDQEICREALIEKYAKGDESSVEQVRRRVAHALRAGRSRSRPHQVGTAFLQPRWKNGFIPAGRINSAAGIQLQATLINCFVQPVGGFDLGSRGRQAGHLHGARGGRRNHAPRRRRGLRLLLHPSQGRRSERHALARERPGVLHARLRPLLRNGRIGRRAPRRPDGRAALRPSRHRGFRPRQGQGATSPISISRSA